MRLVVGLVLAMLSGASCDRRSEEPLLREMPVADPVHTPRSTDARPTALERATDAGAPAAGGRCMVASLDAPPGAVGPATVCPGDRAFGGVELPRGSLSFPDAPGQPAIEVELARTPRERERGLMYRTRMPENHGMLFDFPGQPRVQSFWMHNTCIPLDMLFVAEDGFITGILENVPTLNDESRSIPCPVRYVLEVNAGWTRKHGVKAGQRVELP
ncbi:MAG: DUF192 domain-containing protein [Polyangiaceae bacterium]|jgi:hypothetical protein|nr:DUF192 domain-containing protein [Polyangiaceae bacterium]